jgi:hypothetical protein
VLPHDRRYFGCKAEVEQMPRLEGANDVYVSAPDLSWTMVFTHEDGWFGPYCGEASWIGR